MVEGKWWQPGVLAPMDGGKQHAYLVCLSWWPDNGLKPWDPPGIRALMGTTSVPTSMLCPKNGISFETVAVYQSERQTGWAKVWHGWSLVKDSSPATSKQRAMKAVSTASCRSSLQGLAVWYCQILP